MRLHENNNEEDELQRLRARRQGTDRSRRSVSRASKSASFRTESGTTDRQTRTVNLTYDEDYYEEEDYDYNEDYTENSGSDGLKVPFQNENRRRPRMTSAGSYTSGQQTAFKQKFKKHCIETPDCPDWAGRRENHSSAYNSTRVNGSALTKKLPENVKKQNGLQFFMPACWCFVYMEDGLSFMSSTGYWNIAVFGVDSRDGNTKNALADVQVLCSINQKNGDIKLVSVYRDTYLKIDSKGSYHKINETYFKKEDTNRPYQPWKKIWMKIDDYATFNWKAVYRLSMFLGGVDIDITQPEFKYINAFYYRNR